MFYDGFGLGVLDAVEVRINCHRQFETVSSCGPIPTRVVTCVSGPEIAPELTGHGLPLIKCEAYNRVHDQPYGSD